MSRENVIQEAIDDLKHGVEIGNIIFQMPEDEHIICVLISALEKQAFFENEISEIRDWFVDNEACLSDNAMIVAKNGFLANNADGYIDKMGLHFIVEDIVDVIQRGVLNVLDTYRGD